MTPYPDSLPIEAISRVVTIVRNGEVSTKKAEFVHCAWNIGGFGFKTAFGEPSRSFGDMSDWSTAELRECIAALKDYAEDGESFGAASDDGIDPATLLLLVNLVIKVIQAIVNRRES